MDDLLVRPLAAPPQTHTSDLPIFKNSFDSENSGKLMRHSVAISLINCYHIFWVQLALNHKCTFFTHGYSKDIQKRKALSF